MLLSHSRSASLIFGAFFSLFSLSGCQSTARKVVYSAWEKVGVEKRDILKDRIEDVRDEQKDAGKSFGDALQRLRDMYGVKEGELSKHYDNLKSAYDDAEKDAGDVHTSVKKIETVAGDLFKEWEDEIGEIKTEDLKTKSRNRLHETQKRYQSLIATLKASETKMDAVLGALKDQTLYAKHNLNAQAIGSLKNESNRIEKDIQSLIERMNKSIAESEQFINQL